MIARTGSGWQTVLADLSLILFMVTAAALGEVRAGPPPPAAPASQPVVPALGEPVAVWRAGAEAPPLREWVARTAGDPRLRLTLLAAPEQAPQVLALAASLPRPARIVLDPGRNGVEAALTYDQGEALAQALQRGSAKEILP